MLNTPFAPWPSFTPEEIEAVSAVLASNRVNYWTGTSAASSSASSPPGSERAHAVAAGQRHGGARAGAEGARASARATRSWSRPRTFIASASCVVTAGRDAGVRRCRRRQSEHHRRHDRGGADAAHPGDHLRPPRRHGRATWTRSWRSRAQRGLKVIEDCAQAHGARYRGRQRRLDRPHRRLVLLPGQDHDHRRRGRHGHHRRRAICASRMWSYKDHGKS